ncbi:hypothetical protein ACFUIZ_18905 [Streptomyces cinereoruber]|uniref:hypothetical protein n=1 Tax=Streptomyces cinereoruber TaxID=67260 RepID=UPI003640E420
MTQPTPDARTAVYNELMWPEWNPRSEAYGTSQEQAKELLDAYRAAVLREAADAIEQAAGDMTRFRGSQIAAELRRMAAG